MVSEIFITSLLTNASGVPDGHNADCFAPSPRRPSEEYKRMVVELTHGLFIT
jgi:hypothetical protein